ncbi:MAG: DUF3325 domain-containing protein [Parahaliea sp.]
MTGLNIAIFMASLAGLVALALAMPKHGKQLLRRELPGTWRRAARVLGWLLLALALGLGIARWRFGIGAVTWLGWLAIAGAALVFYLPSWPWQPQASAKAQRPKRARPAAAEAAAPATLPRHRQLPGRTLATAAFVIPLAVFCWQLLTTPDRPLLREDAFRGQVGPWAFTLAEQDRKAPEIVALNVPLKSFVIAFCKGCEKDIRTAYLKVRKPHSPRAAGNAFGGRDREKTAAVPLPRAASLNDGLWLTVESNSGDIYQQELDIQRLSPALAAFIRERS